MSLFSIQSPFSPNGDQPQAILELSKGIRENLKNQVLLGVTGSGKTFTVAHVIQSVQKPTLIIAPNKVLAAQLYDEMKSFFPNNAVEYFVSYYDYYRPEAYVPRSDTFIEKESSINEQIDRMRHAATRSLLERPDVIVVASVSCIYGIGSVESYREMSFHLKVGQRIALEDLLKHLVKLQYKRNDVEFQRGMFRVRGDTLDIFPAHCEDRAWRFSFFGDEVEKIIEIDALTGERIVSLDTVHLYANSHYVTPGPTIQQAIQQIKKDLKVRLQEFDEQGKLLERQRLEQRTSFDLEMLQATGSCAGIENYSRYLTGRQPGEPPPTLFEYFPKDALIVIDESHVTVPQIGGMSRGDAARKSTLIEHGFRLPSAGDNRPLRFEEWENLRSQTIFVSATPAPWELEQTHGVFVEQIVRPTGLLDPICEVRPTQHQIDDLIHEVNQTVSKNLRVLVTTLTKKMAEALTKYLVEAGLNVQYLHSDIDAIERVEIIRGLRAKKFDVLVGINLLREGLDIPECGLVAILDADKEGFLRSKTSLIQTIGRAARNSEGRVLLYADTITKSMKAALEETERRRQKQMEHNERHGITPTTVNKGLIHSLYQVATVEEPSSPDDEKTHEFLLMTPARRKKHLTQLRQQMMEAASQLDFEKAAALRDTLHLLEQKELTLGLDGEF